MPTIVDRRLRQGALARLPDELPPLVACLEDEELWAMAGEERQALIAVSAAGWRGNLRSRGHPPEIVAQSANVLDPNVLTLGFARRFTDYKRPNLLLADPARLARLLERSGAAPSSSSSPARRIRRTRKASK